mgnify:CR=1 FL=1
MFPERFSNLPAYAFPRLRALLDAHAPGGPVVNMTIGEPKHAFPDWVPQVLAENVGGFSVYPPNEGTPELLQNIFYPMISGRASGTGLGLSITQSIIGQHRGLVECESEPGRTDFIIFLPLEDNQ